MSYKLDLHRLRHEDAGHATIGFVETHWNRPAELEIITGNSKKMQKVVTDILEEYDLKYQVGRPYDTTNRGYIVTWTE